MKGIYVGLFALSVSSQALGDAYVRLGYGYSDFRSQDMSIKHYGYDQISMENYDPGSDELVVFSAGYFVTPHFRAELALDMGLGDADTDRVTYTRNNSVTPGGGRFSNHRLHIGFRVITCEISIFLGACGPQTPAWKPLQPPRSRSPLAQVPDFAHTLPTSPHVTNSHDLSGLLFSN